MARSRRAWLAGLYFLTVGGCILLTVRPMLAIIHLEGKPTPYYRINDWISGQLPPGTPVLVDRWMEPWNELQYHNTHGIPYAFTAPDEPLETNQSNQWRKTVAQFYEFNPEAAYLEVNRGKYEKELGPWDFPRRYFARSVSITNEQALLLRHLKVAPSTEYYEAHTNRIIVTVYYNTEEDLIAAARKAGRTAFRFYGEGWGYIKPFWMNGIYDDFRVLNRKASLIIHNLTGQPLRGLLEVDGWAADDFKKVSAGVATGEFEPGKPIPWRFPVTLSPGRNVLPFTSPSESPLYVFDIVWLPETPGS